MEKAIVLIVCFSQLYFMFVAPRTPSKRLFLQSYKFTGMKKRREENQILFCLQHESSYICEIPKKDTETKKYP